MDPALLKQAASTVDKMVNNGSVSKDLLSQVLQASKDAAAAAPASSGFLSGVLLEMLSSLMMPSFSVTSVVFLTLLSFLVARRARSKGRSFWIWFIYTYVAAYIAIIHALLLKEDENGILHAEGMAKCPFCGLHVRPQTKVCPVCRRDLETEIMAVPRDPSEMKPISIIVLSILFIIASKFIELRSGSLLSALFF